jgi:transcription elongation factor Elf1
MNREVEDIFGCFRCGTVRPTCDRNPDTDKIHCGVCGEISVVTFRQALDMLNALWLSNRKQVDESMLYDEYYFDFEETEE